jgi:Ca2+-binding EF-hand superfamily protein
MSQTQTNYNKILQQFRNFNYNEDSTLHKRELKQTLDTIVSRNTSMVEFNPEVAEEIWDEALKEGDGSVKVRNFIDVIVRAQNILKENIGKAES